jgi:hypothetical protein
MEVVDGEVGQTLCDGKLLAFGFPALEIGFECGFEVEGHGSEACALEVEVEVHVVLGGRAVFQLCDGFYF